MQKLTSLGVDAVFTPTKLYASGARPTLEKSTHVPVLTYL